MFDKLKESVKKELEQIGEQGLNTSNLEMTDKLVDIYKDLQEAEQTLYIEKNLKEALDINGLE